MSQSSLDPAASLKHKSNQSSKYGSNADELCGGVSCVRMLSRCGNRGGTASNGAVSCDDSEVGTSKAGGVITVDHNGAIAEEGGRPLGGGEVEVKIAESCVVSICEPVRRGGNR